MNQSINDEVMGDLSAEALTPHPQNIDELETGSLNWLTESLVKQPCPAAGPYSFLRATAKLPHC